MLGLWFSAPTALLQFVDSVPANVFANAATALVAGFGVWLYRKLSNKRIWSLARPEMLVLVVADSSRTPVTKQRAGRDPERSPSAKYVRSATGIGQVRALAAIVPSLQAAYRDLDLNNIRTAREGLGGDQASDLISLGGVKNSPAVSGAIQAALERRYRLCGRIEADWISWLSDTGAREHFEAEGALHRAGDLSGKAAQEEISVDYGYLVKAPNPWNPRAVVVLIAGASTAGTAAAARFFVKRRRWRRPKYFEALVRVDVVGGHGGEPECLHLRRLGKHSQ